MPPSLEIGGITTGPSTATTTDEWESVFATAGGGGATSPGQDQYWLMAGDVEDPTSINKVLHPDNFEFTTHNANLFTDVDQSFIPTQNMFTMQNQNHNQPSIPFELMINQHQAHNTQNPSFFLPLSYSQQEHTIGISPPPPKRHNPGPVGPIPQQAMIDQLYKSAELIQTGNLVHAQGILARLNQHLSPIGKPFHRAAYYFKEALQSLTVNSGPTSNLTVHSSPFSLVYKIGAYKSLSDISPVVQFANFSCNQAMLEVLEGYDNIHVIDFDIGYGGQWASFMQELSLKTGGAPSLKITAFASPSTHDPLELGLIRENLILFATEINMAIEFDILNIDSLSSGYHVSENEAIVVNLPVSSFSNCQLSLATVLRFIKQLSPKVVVSVDKGCDRTDLPFPNHVIHALQSYSNLLESLDAVNVNPDALQKIERFLIQPGIEKIVMSRYVIPEKTQHWRTLFLSSGFSPLTFSNLTETQAECVVKRTPIRGFHVEKRQSSLVLCWQRKELISASAWRC